VIPWGRKFIHMKGCHSSMEGSIQTPVNSYFECKSLTVEQIACSLYMCTITVCTTVPESSSVSVSKFAGRSSSFADWHLTALLLLSLLLF